MKPWYSQFKKDFAGKRVLILGLGLLGRGVKDARFFAEIGAQVTVSDLKSRQELKPSLEQLKDLPIKLVLGEHREKDILSSDLILRNAAVPANSKYLQLARSKGINIQMDEALFAQYAPVKLIGVTGTRGKSTVTVLIYQLLKEAGYPVWLAGNIRGKASLPLLKKVKQKDWLVLELSSWQLQGFRNAQISPQLGVMTNIYQDHLNRYQSMADYLSDKKVIYQFQSQEDYLLINQDNQPLKKMIALDKEKIKAQIVYYSRKNLSSALKKSTKLKGKHNLENIASLLAVAEVLAVDQDNLLKTVKKFKGLPGRLESVATIDGVDYVNDTTSTTPAAGIAALKSFKKPIILIAGGNSKNLKMAGFAKEIVNKAKKAVFLEGDETDKLIALVKKFKGATKILGKYSSLSTAVAKAEAAAVQGDVVLLSPGCTSFGMFKNEFDRGEQFKKIIDHFKSA